MPRLAREMQQTREIRETSGDVRLAILRRIEKLVDSANPVAIEHLATAYAMVADAGPSTGGQPGSSIVDLRSLAAEPGLRRT